MQPDAGLVEDVQDARQAAADLRRQADTLALAARQRARRAIEVEVIEADVVEEAQALDDLFQDAFILTSATLFLALISDYFFLLLLLAPLQAFWILWKNVIAPWIFAPAPEPDEADLKRQNKKERKMQRRGVR